LIGTASEIDCFRRWLLRVLMEATRCPDAFRLPAVVRSFEQELLQRLAKIGTPAGRSGGPAGASRRRQGLERALAYVRTTDPARVTVPELCSAAGVSERTLEYAFRDAVGAPPSSFIRHRRLHAVRHELLIAGTDEGSVGDIANRFGFLHLGRFATDYRRLFGELPSQTLACPSTPRYAPLVFR
jgi:AraC family ethanolamine operon transcriptional activator